MSTPILELRQLVKAYGTRRAVDGVSFKIQAGESVGLLGPNGAGKTTILSLVTGLLRPNAGEILIDGQPLRGDTDPRKRSLGLVPQELALYEELSAYDNLTYFGAIQGLHGDELAAPVKSALEFVGLTERARDRVKTFSGGMKRRLNLAVALLHNPQLLLLDEPTVGVDPQSRNSIFENLEALRGGGKTLLYTTHYMEEVERLCDRVIILDHGKIVADESLAQLRQRSARDGVLALELESSDEAAEGWLDGLRLLSGVQEAFLEGNILHLSVKNLNTDLVSVLDHLRRHRRGVLTVNSHKSRLEDAFLEMTGRTLRDL